MNIQQSEENFTKYKKRYSSLDHRQSAASVPGYRMYQNKAVWNNEIFPSGLLFADGIKINTQIKFSLAVVLFLSVFGIGWNFFVGGLTIPFNIQSVEAKELVDDSVLFTSGVNKNNGVAVEKNLKTIALPDNRSQLEMVQFISGLIAVYLPDISNAGKIATEVVSIAYREKVDPLFVAAVISVESRFLVSAKSRVGAMGLMQLMPSTAQEVSEKLTGDSASPKLVDSTTNILLGVTYLKDLNRRYKGDLRLTLAAYNWGFANLSKVLKGETNLPASVEEYVDRVLTRTSRWKKHHSHASEGAEIFIASLNP